MCEQRTMMKHRDKEHAVLVHNIERFVSRIIKNDSSGTIIGPSLYDQMMNFTARIFSSENSFFLEMSLQGDSLVNTRLRAV
ncbi:hypothetical protein KIN20_023066 [Parelaphostrongylus tenuis]|uniref:Uncharacterized protein n=1 Tax=Parelaphostrongylus tenuis TaxID=148309 RepID=A0AAD5MWB7_PARTN|nr:hypothetical protein KIN20_023066 [Parelaphostrongylus tenuis]